ncbi:MAG: UDP-N-acetylmuramoyl-tripeptide--D-alanyl-D-alanine ligase [Gammaproteobacteria bacterium]|nr:UDP-N-acetylmuramoyl-tripeptide--D-alanyl-D-alanine ligase [Gammaproteobacteria bacterium]
MASSPSAALWKWPELCRALGLPEREGPDINRIVIDSRLAEPGDLFIALPGDPGLRFNASNRSDRDGHDFVAMAAERGAAGALVHRSVDCKLPMLQVPDTLDGLWALGRARRQALDADVVAITGSSGKTTMKSLLAQSLDAFATEGSLNNHLGVPLSLALTPREVTAAVYEIGTSHPGEIAALSKLVEADVAVVLNVHPAHVEYFENLDELRSEKISIYNGLRDKGHLILEESIGRSGLPAGLHVETFGEASTNLCQLCSVEGHVAQYRISGDTLTAHIPGGGRHRAQSLAAVITVLEVLGKDLKSALDLPDDLVPRGRGNVVEIGGITIIDDSYNANPASMQAALTELENQRGRTIAVLGEMLELGEDAEAYHADLVTRCAHIQRVIAVGRHMRALFDALTPDQRWLWQEQADDKLLEILVEGLQAGDRVLIKGSNRVFWARQFVPRLLDRLA